MASSVPECQCHQINPYVRDVGFRAKSDGRGFRKQPYPGERSPRGAAPRHRGDFHGIRARGERRVPTAAGTLERLSPPPPPRQPSFMGLFRNF